MTGRADVDDKAFLELSVRVAAMQERLDNSIKIAADDRSEMKAEIKAVKEDVEEIKATTKSVLDQIKGASRLAKALWAVAGFAVSLAAWLSGVLHKVFPFLPR